LRASRLRTDTAAGAAPRAAVTAAILASSAFLVRLVRLGHERAAWAPASGFGENSAGWAISTGITSPGAMITRMPIGVFSNRRSAKP
jgi:hypothetical protein